MNIQHIHLPQTSSTQSLLKEHLKNHASGHILISTEKQTDGVGRRGHNWDHFSDALAFSFSLAPSQALTLTPLEVGLHLANFFSPNSTLKWPNDILNQKNEKSGGIICQLLNDTILVGVGINILTPKNLENQNYPYPVGGLFSEKELLSKSFKKDLPRLIYEAILNNRLSNREIIEKWSEHCCHFQQVVTIQDGTQKHTGTFLGISSSGEARLLKADGSEVNVLTGSLRF